MKIDNIDKFNFAGYDFSGGYDEGYTIFMFIHKDDEEQGFTLSLRDHEGFNDHNEVDFEDGFEVTEEIKSGVLEKLVNAVEEQTDNEVIVVIKRCIAGLNS